MKVFLFADWRMPVGDLHVSVVIRTVINVNPSLLETRFRF